jgi:hypothetical protein
MDTNRSEKPLTRIITIVLSTTTHLHPPLACALTCYRHASRRRGAGYLVSHTPVRVFFNTIQYLTHPAACLLILQYLIHPSACLLIHQYLTHPSACLLIYQYLTHPSACLLIQSSILYICPCVF